MLNEALHFSRMPAHVEDQLALDNLNFLALRQLRQARHEYMLEITR